jgi:hypothetical protein
VVSEGRRTNRGTIRSFAGWTVENSKKNSGRIASVPATENLSNTSLEYYCCADLQWIHSGKVKHMSTKIYNLKMQLCIKCVNKDKTWQLHGSLHNTVHSKSRMLNVVETINCWVFVAWRWHYYAETHCSVYTHFGGKHTVWDCTHGIIQLMKLHNMLQQHKTPFYKHWKIQ